MAIKKTVSIDWSDLKRLKKQLEGVKYSVTTSTAKEVGKVAVTRMKEFIAKGISPIRGYGRFPGYKNPDKYPGKQKPKRPVNLYLTGDQMKSLKSEIRRKDNEWITDVGYWDPESIDKEIGHRQGANGQLIRPSVPIYGEELNVSIQNEITEIYKEGVEEFLKKEFDK